jgi:hypothetical protein
MKRGMVRPSHGGVFVTCPCCGYPTLRSRDAYDICELCNWEDDGQDADSAEVAHLFQLKPDTVPVKPDGSRARRRVVPFTVASVRLQVNFRGRFGASFRIDPPFSSILTERCTSRSSKASATDGSAIRWCHSETGSWLPTMVEDLPARSSMTSMRSAAAWASIAARPQSSRISRSTRASLSMALR